MEMRGLHPSIRLHVLMGTKGRRLPTSRFLHRMFPPGTELPRGTFLPTLACLHHPWLVVEALYIGIPQSPIHQEEYISAASYLSYWQSGTNFHDTERSFEEWVDRTSFQLFQLEGEKARLLLQETSSSE